MLHVRSVRVVRPYVLWLGFSDGVEGEVDLRLELHGPIFEPLLDAATFARVTVDPEFKTVVWPNGADFATEFLRGLVRTRAAV